MNPIGPALALSGLLLTGTLTGCGGNDTPSVCGSVDDLRTSITSIKDITVTSGSAIEDLSDSLTAIGEDLGTVKKDASSQFATQVDGVESALDALRTGVEAAVADPSAAAIAAVVTTLTAFGDAVQTLVDEIKATC